MFNDFSLPLIRTSNLKRDSLSDKINDVSDRLMILNEDQQKFENQCKDKIAELVNLINELKTQLNYDVSFMKQNYQRAMQEMQQRFEMFTEEYRLSVEKTEAIEFQLREKLFAVTNLGNELTETTEKRVCTVENELRELTNKLEKVDLKKFEEILQSFENDVMQNVIDLIRDMEKRIKKECNLKFSQSENGLKNIQKSEQFNKLYTSIAEIADILSCKILKHDKILSSHLKKLEECKTQILNDSVQLKSLDQLLQEFNERYKFLKEVILELDEKFNKINFLYVESEGSVKKLIKDSLTNERNILELKRKLFHQEIANKALRIELDNLRKSQKEELKVLIDALSNANQKIKLLEQKIDEPKSSHPEEFIKNLEEQMKKQSHWGSCMSIVIGILAVLIVYILYVLPMGWCQFPPG